MTALILEPRSEIVDTVLTVYLQSAEDETARTRELMKSQPTERTSTYALVNKCTNFVQYRYMSQAG